AIGLADLAVDESKAAGDRLKMAGRGAHRSGGDGDGRGLEPLQRLSGGDATDAVTLEQALNRGFVHALGLVGGWSQTPQVEEPIGGDVVGEFEKLRIVAPEQLTDSIGKAVAFDAQVVSDARPF